MALTVNFWTFSKKENSTARPSPGAVRTLSCVLKSDSGILSPILEIGLGMSFNPYALNYAQITDYDRYYFVTDWQWSGGLWLCSLDVDPLATYRTQIGLSTKFVLRSAYDYQKSIIDTFYPTTGRKTYTKTTENAGFATDLLSGFFVLGVISGDSSKYGSITYYGMHALELAQLANIMFPSASAATDWTPTFSGLTDDLYRAIYDPFSHIVSCKWFPYYHLADFTTPAENVRFGNYITAVTGYKLDDINTWSEINFNMSFPVGWVNLDARERCSPYVRISFHLEPFGMIELNPEDFTTYGSISVYIKVDWVSGDALLQIYAGTSRTNGYLVYEQRSAFASNIQLTHSEINVQQIAGALGGAGATIAGARVTGILQAAGNVLDFADGSTRRARDSTGNNSGFNFIDGTATLIIEQSHFTSENNTEFGRPLYQDRTLGNIPGYIKCGDGDISLPGFPEENKRVSEYLVNGFYFE